MTKQEIIDKLNEKKNQLQLLALETQFIELVDKMGLDHLLNLLYLKRKENMNDWIFHNYCPS